MTERLILSLRASLDPDFDASLPIAYERSLNFLIDPQRIDNALYQHNLDYRQICRWTQEIEHLIKGSPAHPHYLLRRSLNQIKDRLLHEGHWKEKII